VPCNQDSDCRTGYKCLEPKARGGSVLDIKRPRERMCLVDLTTTPATSSSTLPGVCEPGKPDPLPDPYEPPSTAVSGSSGSSGDTSGSGGTGGTGGTGTGGTAMGGGGMGGGGMGGGGMGGGMGGMSGASSGSDMSGSAMSASGSSSSGM
jgi:hypothetical protein